MMTLQTQKKMTISIDPNMIKNNFCKPDFITSFPPVIPDPNKYNYIKDCSRMIAGVLEELRREVEEAGRRPGFGFPTQKTDPKRWAAVKRDLGIVGVQIPEIGITDLLRGYGSRFSVYSPGFGVIDEPITSNDPIQREINRYMFRASDAAIEEIRQKLRKSPGLRTKM